ncbi:uncharacterized protein B0H18DRAFT_282886 [Fomitopsis serialis]|uniref:uncharacterized protein n=1 Tax=Fomitopsis serialis TaxID=139415 RepID=UPI002007E16F|nr:uncharacterized protein B0H18DRAFT_282886 [Neoantrodia serialis]KAH9927653.1 hypothetical protein B0H18DRAFT_282886 [Neoantrodia serialis]
MTNPEAALAQQAHGPSLAGIFMNIMLYGVMLSQALYYYTTYKDDSRRLKAYVGLLLMADTLNSVFNMWWIYNVLVNKFGNLSSRCICVY